MSTSYRASKISVEFILQKIFVDRGYHISLLDEYKSLFSGFDGLRNNEWDVFLLKEDTYRFCDLPSPSLWFHFVYGQMFKLVRVLFVNAKSLDENGFSTELATKFMTTLSRSNVSPTDFVHAIKMSFTPSSDFLDLLEHEGLFWTFFDCIVVLIAVYLKPKTAFDILQRLCEVTAGLIGCWEDVVPLLHYFEPTIPISKLSDGQKVALLVGALEKRGHYFRIGISNKDYEILVSYLSQGNDETEVLSDNAEDDKSGEWNFKVPIETLVNNYKILCDEVFIDSNNPVLRAKAKSIQSATYSLVGLGKIVKEEEKAIAIKKASKKQKVYIVDSSDPKSMQSLRNAYNIVKAILRGKSKGMEICGDSLHKDLLEAEGWVSVRLLKYYVQKMASLQKSQPYSLEDRPKWIEEVLEYHDLVGRYELRCLEDKKEVRATHGHQGEASELYKRILMDESRKTKGTEDLKGWIYEKMNMQKVLSEIQNLKKWKTSASPAFRVLFPETVLSIQEYPKQFATYQQLDQDFGYSENRRTQGCFLEVDLYRLEKYYDLYTAPTEKAIYAFSRNNQNPPFYISLMCFTGRIWEMGESTPQLIPELEENYVDGSDRIPDTPVTWNNAKGNASGNASGTKLEEAENAFAEDEMAAREQIQKFVLTNDRKMTIEIRKTIFLHRKEKMKQFKNWITDQNLVYVEDKSNPATTCFEISKLDHVSHDECVALREELLLPQDFNVELIQRAVTISEDNAQNYEQLEFVGDAVLGCIIAVDKLIQVSSRTTSNRDQSKIEDHSNVVTDMSNEDYERSVVSFICSNKIITHLLPPLLAHRFHDRGLKVKADVVEALIGAMYEGNCGMDGTRDGIRRLYERIPGLLQSANTLTDEEKEDLRKAWDLCPYNQPGVHRTDIKMFYFNMVRVVNVETREEGRITAGGDAHAAMIGFSRIQMKKYATHFTSGNVFCYRRIFPDDTPQIINRIVCGAEKEMTFVNEVITERMRLVIDYDGASIFSFNFYTYLMEWAAEKTNGRGRFLVATSSGSEKESCHIHFFDWIIPLTAYTDLINDIEKYVEKRKGDFFHRLQNAMSRSSAHQMLCIGIPHSFLPSSQITPALFNFCNIQDLSNICAALPEYSPIVSQCLDYISPTAAVQRFCVPHDQIMLGEVKQNMAKLVYLQFMPKDTNEPTNVSLSESNSWQRWILGQDIYEDLQSIFINVTDLTETKDKLKKSYLDRGLAKSGKLRMVFCDKCDMSKGRVNRPVYPFIVSSSTSDGVLHQISRLIHSPVMTPMIPLYSKKQQEMWKVVASASPLKHNRYHEDKKLFTEEEEVWDEAYVPTTLRRQFQQKEGRPFILSCMDSVILTSLREPVVRDVLGRPYSSWNSAKREGTSFHPSSSSIPFIFSARSNPECGQRVSAWRLPSDIIPRNFYRPYRGSVTQPESTESLKKAHTTETKLSQWFSMFRLSEEYAPPTGSINYADENEEQAKKRASQAKTRCLLPTWIIYDNNRLSFLVAGEVVARSKPGSPSDALKDLGQRVINWLTPHFPFPDSEDKNLLASISKMEIYLTALPIELSLSLPHVKKPIEIIKECVPLDVRKCISGIVEKFERSVEGCLIVVDDNSPLAPAAFNEFIGTLKTFFGNILLFSQCADYFSFLRIHEYSKVFMLSESDHKTKNLCKIIQKHRSSALIECTIHHISYSV